MPRKGSCIALKISKNCIFVNVYVSGLVRYFRATHCLIYMFIIIISNIPADKLLSTHNLSQKYANIMHYFFNLSQLLMDQYFRV